jgi:hypothetical protein
MSEQMVSHMRSLTQKQIDSAVNVKTEYNPEVEMKTPEWLIREVA